MDFITGNLNKGVAGLMGLPVDTARNALNLGRAAQGTLAGIAGADIPGASDWMPPLIEPGVGSGQWFEDMMRRSGMITPASDPTSTLGRYGAAALQAIPAVLTGRMSLQQAPRATAGQAVSGMAGEAAADIGGEEYRGVGTMAPGARQLAKPPSAADRARTERQAQRFETAREMDIPIPPRAMKEHGPRNKMEDATNKDLGFPPGTELTPKTLKAFASQLYDDGYKPLVTAPELKGGLKPNNRFQKSITELGDEISSGTTSLPETFKSSQDAVKLLAEYGYAQLPQGVKASGGLPPRQQAIPTADAVKAIQKLREDAKANYASEDAAKIAQGKVQRGIADALEQLIDDSLASSKNTQLLQGFRDARVKIAKAHDVEMELDPRTGKLSPNRAASIQAERPLSGGLKDVSDVAREFPGAMQGPRSDEYFTKRVTPMAMMHPTAMATHFATRWYDPIMTNPVSQQFIVNPRSRLTPEQYAMLRMLTAAQASGQIPVPPEQ